ncbi:MAG: bacillithiol system redox-active protein YtxJ [Gemmatimonas sp.]|uniref:bacillithiol system redox-active protein YtxJ n=1 Tax=Gemmatimonas sp. TaxID=1962908 RepID=UPI00391F1DD9
MNSSSSVATVTDADFPARVHSAPGLVLVDVWAGWCTPCLTLKPVIERLAESYRDRVTVLTLDADTNLETVTRFDVRSLPTVLLFADGALVERSTGAQSYGRYTEMLDHQLAARAAGRPPEPVAAATAVNAPPRDDSPTMREVRELAVSAEPLVLFKHSATCPISSTAKRQFDAFADAHPEGPTRIVVVQRERPLSNAIEDALGVQHESPQAIVVQGGRVVWHASHGRITADALKQAVKTAGLQTAAPQTAS